MPNKNSCRSRKNSKFSGLLAKRKRGDRCIERAAHLTATMPTVPNPSSWQSFGSPSAKQTQPPHHKNEPTACAAYPADATSSNETMSTTASAVEDHLQDEIAQQKPWLTEYLSYTQHASFDPVTAARGDSRSSLEQPTTDEMFSDAEQCILALEQSDPYGTVFDDWMRDQVPILNGVDSLSRCINGLSNRQPAMQQYFCDLLISDSSCGLENRDQDEPLPPTVEKESGGLQSPSNSRHQRNRSQWNKILRKRKKINRKVKLRVYKTRRVMCHACGRQLSAESLTRYRKNNCGGELPGPLRKGAEDIRSLKQDNDQAVRKKLENDSTNNTTIAAMCSKVLVISLQRCDAAKAE